MAIAPSDYGKTVATSKFILNLVKTKIIEPKHILIFSTTFKSDPAQRDLVKELSKNFSKFKDKNCFEEINEKLIKDVFTHNKILKDSDKEYPQWLFVFDDQITADIIKKKSGIINVIATRGRHYGIS